MKRKELLTKVLLGVLALTLIVTNTGFSVSASEVKENENASAVVAAEDAENVENTEGAEGIEETENVEETGISEVTLNVGATEESVSVTWYTNVECNNITSHLQYAVADESNDTTGVFPEQYTEIEAKVSPTVIEGYYSNSVTIGNLLQDTKYVYRVSGKDAEGNEVWSEIYSYTTKNTNDEYEFFVVGDPQIGSSNTATDTVNWEITMHTAMEKFSNASFLISVGDQINSTRNDNTKAEGNFAGFLSENTGFAGVPVASSVGNHDNSHLSSYTSHFTLPNISEYGSSKDSVTGEEDYYFTYGNTLFMMLNTNNSSIAEHKAFMEKAISKNSECKWRVVAFHQSIYSVARHVNDGNIAELRVGLSPIFAQNDIDVVLMGHDHVYARSYIMGGVTGMQAKVTESAETEIINPDGVQYITFNSGSGSKYYDITQELYEYTAVQNQEKVPNYSHVKVTADSFMITTYRATDNSVVDTVTLYKTDSKSDVLKDTVKIVGTTQTASAKNKVGGHENAQAQLLIEKTAEYDSGVINPEGGSSEIVQYNSDTKMYYVVNGTTGTLDIVPRLTQRAKGIKCDIKGELAELRPDFAYGDMTSVAVSEEMDLIAIAVQAAGTADEGLLVFMNYKNEIVAVTEAGVQPDMVTFTEDGKKVLTANEGEPRDGYVAASETTQGDGVGIPGMGMPGIGGNQEPVDPAGTVTIADLSKGAANVTTKEVTFEEYDTETARAALIDAGVIIKKRTKPSVDFEPEYIAVNGNTAYVTLQEANAIAVVDIETGKVTGVNSLGFKDYNLEKNALDLADDGKINITTANVYGIYMPDAISTFTANGKTYVVTANEGDSREWGEEDSDEYHCNEAKTKDINGKKVTIFDVTEYEGLDSDKTYIFGGRSFAIYEINADATMTQIYESGNDFEKITAELLPTYFNCSNDDIELDSRSGKKGPEAESVVVGKVGEKTYAFVGIERIGGIMVYDVTNPANVLYVNYINSREFTADIAGDVSPEGLAFIPESESVSGNAELLVAHEVSGTVAVYELKEAKPETDNNKEENKKPDAVEKIVLSEVAISLSKINFNYDGKVKKTSVTVKIGNKVLRENVDYTITYTNNKNIGKAKVILVGKGNYTGTVTKTFKITVKKGTIYTVGAYKYKITSGSTVAFAGIKNNKTTKVTIPKTVKIGGKTFKVTAIADKALANKGKITKVTIGANVVTIGKEAFRSCKKLSNITIKSTKLKSIGKNALKGIKATAKVTVPVKKLNAYRVLFKGKGQNKKVKITK